MKKPVRGRCLIFSNQTFSNLSLREGNERDIEGLRLLFSQLHFVVIPHNDLTAAVCICFMNVLFLTLICQVIAYKVRRLHD
jgi:hypothetical protein